MKKLTVSLFCAVMLVFTACGSQSADSNGTTSDGGGSIPQSIGSAVASEADFEYEEVDGGVKITKYIGAGGDVVIPGELDGKTVAEIGFEAFINCTSLTGVVIPEGTIIIRRNAFDGCTSLSSVTIPSSLTEIADQAFYGCTGLTEIVIPGNVEVIGSAAFDNCTSLSSVTLEEGVAFIRLGAFSKCTSLKSITLPNSMVDVSSSAFEDCEDIIITYNGQTYTYEQQYELYKDVYYK